MNRPFRVPFSPVFPLIGVAFCVYLMAQLPGVTWLRFLIWLVVGLIIYFSYSRRHSRARLEAAQSKAAWESPCSMAERIRVTLFIADGTGDADPAASPCAQARRSVAVDPRSLL